MNITERFSPCGYPERIVQFGEGNFLRGFVDWFIDGLNKKGGFNSSVVIVQPLKDGMCDAINEQKGLYTLVLRGIQGGAAAQQSGVINCISRCVNPYRDYSAFLDIAHNPKLRFVFSNTTEAGIVYDGRDSLSDAPPSSFPGKVAALLYERYKHFGGDQGRGLIFIACELIDQNGQRLKECVLKYARQWGLPEGFIRWVDGACVFANSLVDRIVTGYPSANAAEYFNKLGYNDRLLDTAEIFHLWVIEGMKGHEHELPLDRIGYNVIFTDDITPYKTRKVRILNGAHTMTAPAAYLSGCETVREFMEHPVIGEYVRKGVFEEIIPATDMPKAELEGYAKDVLERFKNPYIRHRCLDISLNSVSKFKERVLPSIKRYAEIKGALPNILTFSLAALIVFYRGAEARDNPEHLEFFKKAWEKGSPLDALSNAGLWGEDLTQIPGLSQKVGGYLNDIASLGMPESMKKVCLL